MPSARVKPKAPKRNNSQVFSHFQRRLDLLGRGKLSLKKTAERYNGKAEPEVVCHAALSPPGLFLA